MRIELFPKEFGTLTAAELMELCLRTGIDAPTVMVRDGYWVTPAGADAQLGDFMRTARQYGLRPDYAQTGLQIHEITPENRLLRTLSAHGIGQARMGMTPKEIVSDYRELPDFFARAAEKAERAGRACGVRCVIQIHGNLYPHTATAVFPMVRDLDPQYIGVKLDPGNNLTFEGYERFDYQIRLLREYITAVGVKDTAIERAPGQSRGGKGWSRRFVPVTEGMADYDLILRELRGVGFDGPLIMMPFYPCPPGRRAEDVLAEEVRWLRDGMREDV